MKKQDEEKKETILNRAFEDVLLDMIDKYPSPEELKGTQKFSAEHEIKIQDIINDAQKRDQNNSSKNKKSWYRIGLNVAAAFGGLCLITTLMAFTVPPVRIALQDYFMRTSDEYLEIQTQLDKEEFENEVFNYPTYIPSGFKVDNSQEGDTFLMVFYTNEEEKFIRLERFVGKFDMTIDIEDVEHREIDIQGKVGQMAVENGEITIVFSNSEYSFKITTDVSEKESAKIVESILEK